MPDLPNLGRGFIILGAILLLLGVAFLFGGKIARVVGPFGRLPGDIVIRRGNFTLYFPLGTSLLVSLALTAILWLLRRR